MPRTAARGGLPPPTVASEYRICLLDANAPQLPLAVLPPVHAHIVTHIRWHASGAWLLSADEGGQIIVWRTRVRPDVTLAPTPAHAHADSHSA